jgi:DNA-binding XRE family transcriptional regulator
LREGITDEPRKEQNRTNIQKYQREISEQRERMENTPWIRLRNRLVTELANKRRELGITQKDMAKALNTSNGTITRFENMSVIKNGKPTDPPNPTIKTIASYAAVLGVELEFRLVNKK